MKHRITLILTFFIILSFVKSETNCIFVNNSVAVYHVIFLHGNIDSVKRFQQKFPYIVNNKYVYIAYLKVYSNHEGYKDLIRSHYKYLPAD